MTDPALDASLRLVKEFEDCILHAYPDPASPLGVALQRAGRWRATLAGTEIPSGLRNLSGAPWTIGYGATGTGISANLTWSQEQADADVLNRVSAGLKAVRSVVHVALNPMQAAALVSLRHNIGADAFRNSTLVRLLNAGNYAGAALQFPRWNRAGGHELAGLTNRRAKEQAVFQGRMQA